MMETMMLKDAAAAAEKEEEEEEEDDDEMEEEEEEEEVQSMDHNNVDAAEDDCTVGATESASLETDIQAQRVVALEESRLDAAVEELLKLENRMRRAADVSRTRRVAVAIVQLCYDAQAWNTLNDQIRLLSQRQPQLQQVVKAMVQQAAQYIDDAPDMDTRNELIRTLDNISSGKWLRKICWYVVLRPDDNLQADPTKPNPMEMLKQADPPRACEPIQQQLPEVQEPPAQPQERAQKWKYEKYNGLFQDRSPEEFDAPTCESRPNMPPSQHEIKAEEIPRLPSNNKKVANTTTTTTTRRTARIVCRRRRRRRLFDSPSPAEMEDFFSEFEERECKRFTDRYNFDPLKDAPLPGRFEWVSLQSQSITSSRLSSTGIQRSSTV